MNDFFRQIDLTTEALCIERNWPCTRHFTHEELAPAIQGLREAAELLKEDSFRAIRQVNAEREGSK
jgi:hypothetical protein